MTTNPDWLAALETVAAEASFSGLVGIDRRGLPPIDRAIGLADRRWQMPVVPDSILAIASGAKGFTALTVMSLVTDGTLSLDTTARSLLGADLPQVADDVTVRHLLGHRSGIGDYLDESDHGVTDYVLPAPVHRYVHAEDYLPALDGHPTVFAADERFAYNNGGFVLLAILAERAAGAPYHQLVHDRVHRTGRHGGHGVPAVGCPAAEDGDRLPGGRRAADEPAPHPAARRRRRRAVHDARGHALVLGRAARRTHRAARRPRRDDPAPQRVTGATTADTGSGSGCRPAATRSSSRATTRASRSSRRAGRRPARSRR